MTDDHDRRYRIDYRADFQEHAKIRHWAAAAGITPEEWCARALARAIRTWSTPPVPPPAPVPRHRETQTERRARLRAASPDGMSPYTRELQTIRPTKETTP